MAGAPLLEGDGVVWIDVVATSELVVEMRIRSISSLIEESFSMNVSLEGTYASGW